MKKFKLGVAVVLSILTALSVIAFNANGLNAMGETLDGLMGIALAAVSCTIALPCWLVAITCWQIAHKQSYLQFKNWCNYQMNEILRP